MFWAVNHGSSGRIQSLIDTVRTRQLHARTQAVKCLSGWPPQRHAQHHPRRPPCVPSTLRCTRSFATLVSSVDRQHIPHAKRRAPLGHSTNDPAERPARSVVATKPVTERSFTNAVGSWSQRKQTSRAHRRANALITRRSCACFSSDQGWRRAACARVHRLKRELLL